MIIRDTRYEVEDTVKMSLMSRGLKLEYTAYIKEGQTASSHLGILTTMGGRRSVIMPIPSMRSRN